MRVACFSRCKKRRARKGCAAEVEAAMRRMMAAASAFPGHLGGHLLVPDAASAANPLLQVIFAFDSQAHLDAWMQSSERAALLATMKDTSFDDATMNVLSGLEGWFALPAQATKKPPPRPKMALVTWLGIFPLVLVMSTLVAPIVAPINAVLSVAVVTALVVVLMTWLVMPLLTRLFAGWLYPSR